MSMGGGTLDADVWADVIALGRREHVTDEDLLRDIAVVGWSPTAIARLRGIPRSDAIERLAKLADAQAEDSTNERAPGRSGTWRAVAPR